ncbi:hypothetical protein [Butyrivibrio sp. AE2032]|uniref:hypothetical protein n=1 Tax=Butyrivibrio sp. AE2032 TaxID=1458463 RepID=UPI000557556F|nr:hypothetical protein [Butyrivibrio sp. AE2032]
MDFSKAYGSIAVLEVEIRTFANEGYAVKYDFERKVISWRDNYMWNNNFTRSINDDKMAIIMEKLPASGMLEWMHGYNLGLTDEYGDKTVIPGEWKIEVEFKDKTKMKAGAEQHFPKKWKNLKNLIEQTTGCSFVLR